MQGASKNSLNVDFPAELPGPEYKMELVWRNIIIFVVLHIGAIIGLIVTKRTPTKYFSKLI